MEERLDWIRKLLYGQPWECISMRELLFNDLLRIQSDEILD